MSGLGLSGFVSKRRGFSKLSSCFSLHCDEAGLGRDLLGGCRVVLFPAESLEKQFNSFRGTALRSKSKSAGHRPLDYGLSSSKSLMQPWNSCDLQTRWPNAI